MIGGEDLYTRYAEKVCRYLFALCGRAETAEKLTQETFCRALAGQKSLSVPNEGGYHFGHMCFPLFFALANQKASWTQSISSWSISSGDWTKTWWVQRLG